MKQLLIQTLVGVALAASPAMAQEPGHQHSDKAPNAKTEAGQHGKASMSHGSTIMQEHQEKMQAMRALMEKARATKDPEQRARLMAEHHQIMQQRMAAMMDGDQGGMMQRCHDRMTMMHDMMSQMAAEQKMMAPSADQ